MSIPNYLPTGGTAASVPLFSNWVIEPSDTTRTRLTDGSPPGKWQAVMSHDLANKRTETAHHGPGSEVFSWHHRLRTLYLMAPDKGPIWNPADPVYEARWLEANGPGPAPMTPAEWARFQAELARKPLLQPEPEPDPFRARPGGSWIFDRPDTPPAIWGDGDEVAWAEGEALMVVGPDGTGKTVLAGNLVLRLLEIDTRPLLGLPVRPRRRILYLAQDRPSQAARAFRRLVGTIDRPTLDQRLRVIDWPIEQLDANPAGLLELAQDDDCDTVIVDSVKDVVAEPSSEKSGQAIKTGYQLAIASGVEVCLLHHDRKQIQDGRARRLLKLADVYGSRFMVAGCGSVIALNDRSGDPVIELRHLKLPAAEVGPLRITFNFETGEIDLYEGGDLLAILASAKVGLTAQDAARQLYETDKPSYAERERARRKLKSLVGKGLVVEAPSRGEEPARFSLTPPLTLSLTSSLTEIQL